MHKTCHMGGLCTVAFWASFWRLCDEELLPICGTFHVAGSHTLERDLGQAQGEMAGYKAAQRKPPKWWVALFGGRDSR